MLRTLWGLRVPVTAADVARRTRMTHPAASATLRALSELGLIESAPAGRGHTYWMDRENIYVDRMLDPVFSAEGEMPELLLAELQRLLEPLSVSAVLYGSYARGDQTPDSDIDVVVVVEDTPAKTRIATALADLADEFENRFGARLSPIIYDRGDAVALAERAPGLWASVTREGVTVSGLSPSEWGAHAAG